MSTETELLGHLAKIYRNGRDNWYGPELRNLLRPLVDTSDNAVPTEKAIRTAIGVDSILDGIKPWYVFEDADERDAFFVQYPHLLVTDVLIMIKDPSPAGVRKLDFTDKYNSQYLLLGFP